MWNDKKRTSKKKEVIMLYAEWTDCSVSVLDASRCKQLVRRFRVRQPVVGVQISGDSHTDATIAIAMNNGRAEVYKMDGTLIRR